MSIYATYHVMYFGDRDVTGPTSKAMAYSCGNGMFALEFCDHQIIYCSQMEFSILS